ncbi:unnamed protein product, partial [marine sediment metagenome]
VARAALATEPSAAPSKLTDAAPEPSEPTVDCPKCGNGQGGYLCSHCKGTGKVRAAMADALEEKS